MWKDANSRGGSVALHQSVNEGDTLQVSLPRNRFCIPAGTKRAILIARGIGVTPILSIADHLKLKDIPFELHYVFALMSPDSIRATIAASNFSENTKFYLEATEANQLLDPAAVLAERPDDTQLFICGADWWQDPIIKVAGRRAMVTDADVWQSAWIIAEQYGAEGVDFAAQMAHSFEIGGKLDAQKVWLSIMQKVETLTSEAVRAH